MIRTQMHHSFGSLALTMSLTIACATSISPPSVDAQLSNSSQENTEATVIESFSNNEIVQGHVHREDVSYFIFSPKLYGVPSPTRVVLTGEFRTWSQDMDDTKWQLQKQSTEPELWTIAIPNKNFERIPPSSPFKFRIDQGDWMEPPREASNREGGNLVFADGIKPKKLVAEIRNASCIWIQLTGENANRSIRSEDYRLRDSSGNEIAIASVLPNTANDASLFLAEPIDVRRVYYLEMPNQKLRVLCRRDGWFRTMYSNKTLGAEIDPSGNRTSFRIFAPRADAVRLYLYRNAEDSPQQAIRTIELTKDADGVWETVVTGDQHGIYYDYTIHGPTDPGNYFYETHPVHITDPYARVSLDSFGKARVWRNTVPASPLTHGRPPMENVIAYEVHVQDFTDQLPVDPNLRGTIPGMIERGLKNSHGEPIGFDYLIALGINVVHLMPMQEYLHYPDAEWQAAFATNPFMKEHGVNLENYDWGYRTTHAFAVETRFRRRDSEHGAQRDQFRDLVQAFHDHGIAVIIDLVPNHTGENMDGRHYLFNFNAIDMPYYYRTNDTVQHIGPYGNEVKTEERPMVKRWLIDQCKHFINEFGIDGFRIDLAGQIDKQTLIKLRDELGDDVIIYGEPWIPPTDPEVSKHPDWGWYKKDAPITFFQDDARNAFKGPTSNPRDKVTSRGFAGGDKSQRTKAMQGLLNDHDDEAHPNMGINYLDIHDNWALADQFATTDWDGRKGVDEGPFRIAAGMLFTSLGPIVLHGGTEIMRTKGSAGLAETWMETASGKLLFHGKSDTYNMRTPNQYQWDSVGAPPTPSNGNRDTGSMLAYWKGLIAFRNSNAGSVFRMGVQPPAGYYRWILPQNEQMLGYIVADRVLVLINTSQSAQTFHDVELPQGDWKLISDGVRINHVRGVGGNNSLLKGVNKVSLPVPATTMMIWLRN